MDRHQHVDMSDNAGVYSTQELEDSWVAVQYSQFRKTVSSRLATTVCNQMAGSKCPQGGLTLVDFIQRDPLHKLLQSAWKTLYQDLVWFGTICAGCFGIFFIFKTIFTIITYLLNLLFLVPLHGFSLTTCRNARTSQIARTAYVKALERTVYAFHTEGRNNIGEDVEMREGENGENGDVRSNQ